MCTANFYDPMYDLQQYLDTRAKEAVFSYDGSAVTGRMADANYATFCQHRFRGPGTHLGFDEDLSTGLKAGGSILVGLAMIFTAVGARSMLIRHYLTGEKMLIKPQTFPHNQR